MPSIPQGLHLLYNFMERKIMDWDLFCLVKLPWEKHDNTYEVFSTLSVFTCPSQQQFLSSNTTQEFHSILRHSFCTNKSQAKVFPKHAEHHLSPSSSPDQWHSCAQHMSFEISDKSVWELTNDIWMGILEGIIMWHANIQQNDHLSISISDLDFILNCAFFPA